MQYEFFHEITNLVVKEKSLRHWILPNNDSRVEAEITWNFITLKTISHLHLEIQKMYTPEFWYTEGFFESY